MSRILILGGGFAGLSAARALRRSRQECVLVDQRAAQEFLPLLPDLIGREFPPDLLRLPYTQASDRWGFRFLRARVSQINAADHVVHTLDGPSLRYDALIIALGSVSADRGVPGVREHARMLDGIADAHRIAQQFRCAPDATYLVAGGGYTGVELATNLARLSRHHGGQARILIAESGDALCRATGPRCSAYVTRQAQLGGVELLRETRVASVDGTKLELTNGERLTDTHLLWATGVETPPCVRALDLPQTPDGRLICDASLRLADGLFVAGDCAGVTHRGHPLRMSIQAALMQGAAAARNAERALKRHPPRRYRPVDLGYVVPLAHGVACGNALGIPVKGRPGMLLHYLMCLYRTWLPATRHALFRHLLHPDLAEKSFHPA